MQITQHENDLDALLPEWTTLFAADDRATPFQSPAWARAWWRYWGTGFRPWLLEVRDAGELVGLAPLWKRRSFGLQALCVNGDPGDYWDVLARPSYRTAVEELIVRELHRRRREWDVLVLSRITPGSSMADAAERAGFRTAHRSAVACPGLSLPGSFDAYLGSLPSSRRKELRRVLRGLDNGELRLRIPEVAELPDAIGRWQSLRVRQWAARGRRISQAHREARFRDFIVEVVTALVPAEQALVWEFLREGEVVGSFVNFCNRRTFYQYLGGFAPEWKRLSIGKLAVVEGIRSSITAGRSYYDFMRGAEEYKYWYGAVDRFSPTVVMARGWVSWAGAIAGRLWD